MLVAIDRLQTANSAGSSRGLYLHGRHPHGRHPHGREAEWINQLPSQWPVKTRRSFYLSRARSWPKYWGPLQ